MLIAKVPAVVAAVLFMSSVSAQAMEFADRPGPIAENVTSALAIRAIQSEELADRPRPNLRQVWVAQGTFQTKLGRLSAEFSAVAKSSRMKFEYGPGEVSSWLKPLLLL